MAEIIPFEPDTDNAGVGSGKTKTVIGAISYEGKRIWLFCETTIPQADNLNTLKGTMGSL